MVDFFDKIIKSLINNKYPSCQSIVDMVSRCMAELSLRIDMILSCQSINDVNWDVKEEFMAKITEKSPVNSLTTATEWDDSEDDK